MTDDDPKKMQEKTNACQIMCEISFLNIIICPVLLIFVCPVQKVISMITVLSLKILCCNSFVAIYFLSRKLQSFILTVIFSYCGDSAQAFNPCTQEAETVVFLRAPGHSGLQRKFEGSQSYKEKHCLEESKTNKQKTAVCGTACAIGMCMEVRGPQQSQFSIFPCMCFQRLD